MSQQKIAQYLDVAQRTNSSYETGNIPTQVIVKLAYYYETTTDYLLGLTDERLPYPRIKWESNKNKEFILR